MHDTRCILISIALLCVTLGNLDEALEDAHEAVKLSPTNTVRLFSVLHVLVVGQLIIVQFGYVFFDQDAKCMRALVLTSLARHAEAASDVSALVSVFRMRPNHLLLATLAIQVESHPGLAVGAMLLCMHLRRELTLHNSPLVILRMRRKLETVRQRSTNRISRAADA